MGRLRHLRRQPRAQLEDVLPFVFERSAEHAAGRSTALAALVLKERVSPTRMAGAIAVAAGVALVSL